MSKDYQLQLNQGSVESLSMFANTAGQPLESIQDDILALEELENTSDACNKLIADLDVVLKYSENHHIEPVKRLIEKIIQLVNRMVNQESSPTAEQIDCLLAASSHASDLINRIQTAVANFSGEDQIIDLSEQDDTQADISQWLDDEINAKPPEPHNVPQAETPETQAPPAPNELSLDTPMSAEDVQIIGFTPQMVQDYIVEGQDYIKSSEDALLDIENNPDNMQENIDVLLRAFHSLKGNSGLIVSVIKDNSLRGRHIVNKIKLLTHSAESIVQLRRDQKKGLSPQEMELMFQVCDSVKWMINAFYNGDHTGKDMSSLFNALQALTQNEESKLSSSDESQAKTSNIHKDTALIKTLKQIMEIMEAGIKELSDANTRQKAAKKMKRGLKTLVKTTTVAKLDQLQEIADSAIDALEKMTQNWNQEMVAQGMAVLASVPASIGNVVTEKTSAISQQQKASPPGQQPGDDLLQKKSGSDIQTAMIKVPQERLDHLMNLIGELVVHKNGLMLLARNIAIEDNRPDIGAKVKDSASVIGRIGDELQTSIMAVRMTPVNHVFNRFPRLVRDLARDTGKEVKLHLKGQDTELDKKIIEAIGTPLVHLIRNAVDHGIESPDERKKAGKPPQANLTLHAYNEGSNVFIDVKDDGQGIDAAKIGAIAARRGLITMEALDKMTDEQIRQLIFTPGFSSAKKVTDISGRGVGMDVVRKEIEAISGTIHLKTTPGQMTTVSLRLPLTLAVSNGLNVEVNGEQYYIPLEYVSETIKIHNDRFHTHRGDQMVLVRNQILPVKELSRILMLPSESQASDDGLRSMVILDVLGQKSALAVDRFYREEEYVIKTIEGPLGKFSEFMGATITSQGKVIMVLNPLKL